MKTPTDFAKHLGAFLSSYLPAQRNASPNTVKAYRDAFTLFLRYCRDHRKASPDGLCLEHINVDLLVDFLQHLEKDRHCGKSTINQRLAALHAFFRYLQVEEPGRIDQCQRILAIPFRRHPQPVVNYLTKEDLSAILKRPSQSDRAGRRDAVLLSLLYDTGARVQEIIDLSVEDVRLDAPAQVRLVGKGRKVRVVPLMDRTAAIVTKYLTEQGLHRPDRCKEPLFQNRWGERLSRSGVRYILAKYVEKARVSRKGLPRKISPHTLRHTKAMHLLQSGNHLVIIRDILGHADIKTTEVYAKADLEMRQEALKKAAPDSPTPVLRTWMRNKGLLSWLRSLQAIPGGCYVESTTSEIGESIGDT
jgi:integrase/recombinase XerD